MRPSAVRQRRHRKREDAGWVVVPVEVSEADIEGLEQARLLPARADYTRADLARAIKELLGTLRLED
jgi:hypothetical protein